MSEFLTLLNLPDPPAPPAETRSEKRDGSLENPAIPLNWPVELEMDGLFGPTSDAGVRVSPLIASQQATVHACVRVRAESMAQLPLSVFEKVKVNGVEGVEVAEDHPVHDLIHHRPNPFMSSHVFRECMQMCLDIHGNAYAVIERDNANRPLYLWPRNPDKITPCIKVNDGNEPDEMYFMDETGTKENPASIQFWRSDQMLHLVGLGFDGIRGLSPIKYFMKNAIGLALAADQFGARFFANNGRPGGLLVYKGSKLDPKTKEDIKNSWQEAQAGKNTGRPAVLTGDWDWKQMQIPANEMQFLETRKFQMSQIAGMYRVPAHMIGDLSRSTNNNIEHQSLEFVKYCLQPQITKWQSELTFKLLQSPDKGRNAARKFFACFDTSEMVMGDFKDTMSALSVGLLNGTYSVNEARKKLNLNSIGPEGDEHTVQSQLTTLEALAALATVTAAQSKQDIKDIKAGKTAAPDPAPNPNEEGGDQPDDNLGDGSRYALMFQDAFNRVCIRERRDPETVSNVFKPLLTTVANDLMGIAQREFKAAALPIEIVSKVVADQSAGMAKRAEEWKSETSDGELAKAVRSLRVAIFKEVAVQKAKGK
jgi:HK97 family phage portal protein